MDGLGLSQEKWKKTIDLLVEDGKSHPDEIGKRLVWLVDAAMPVNDVEMGNSNIELGKYLTGLKDLEHVDFAFRYGGALYHLAKVFKDVRSNEGFENRFEYKFSLPKLQKSVRKIGQDLVSIVNLGTKPDENDVIGRSGYVQKNLGDLPDSVVHLSQMAEYAEYCLGYLNSISSDIRVMQSRRLDSNSPASKHVLILDWSGVSQIGSRVGASTPDVNIHVAKDIPTFVEWYLVLTPRFVDSAIITLQSGPRTDAYIDPKDYFRSISSPHELMARLKQDGVKGIVAHYSGSIGSEAKEFAMKHGANGFISEQTAVADARTVLDRYLV